MLTEPKPRKSILIVEDDAVQIAHLELLITRNWPEYEVLTLRYEREFIDAAANWRLESCAAAIVDCHLWWDAKQQRQSEAEGHNQFRAGVRCIQALVLHTTGRIPIALRTIVDRRDIMPDLRPFGDRVAYFGKSDIDDEKLIRFLATTLRGGERADWATES